MIWLKVYSDWQFTSLRKIRPSGLATKQQAVSRSQGTHEVMSSEINLTGRMLASRSGKGGRERAGTNLQADHGEEQAVSVQEVEHLRRTRVSGAQAVAMGRRRGLTAG